ncbi:transporter substrate-binding domain-containing protein [Bradyrhizobium sp. LA7.1]|uniref:transporter substrate-binding domain-containing protein n=1 Tax=Bradyrhizobium sp. LA7.1 TaxID=3156324 RepID=UPI00339A185B
MRRLIQYFCIVASLLSFADAALAQTNALDAIRQRKKVIIGVLLDGPPFGMLDEKMEPTGYDVEVARKLAKDLGVDVEFVQTTVPNRVVYLQSSRVDLIMAAFSVTPERALSVAFSSPYGTLNHIIVGGTGVHAATIADLVGKRVAVSRGSFQDMFLTKAAPSGTQIQRYDDDATAHAALASGQVDLAAMAEPTARAVISKSAGKPMEIKFRLSEAPFSIGIRKGDPELLQWLNTWIYYHRRVTGEFDVLHRKYLGSGIPADLGYF